MKKKYLMKEKVWIYPGSTAAWHFISLPKKDSAQIKKEFGSVARGWGSLRVVATIGKTSWKTSIFPEKQSGCYLLPLKAEVRSKEGVAKGDTVKFAIEIV